MHAHWHRTQDSMQYAPRVLHFSAFHYFSDGLKLMSSRFSLFPQEFSSASNPMVILGNDMLQRPDADAIYSAVVAIASSGAKSDQHWKTLNVLHRVSYPNHYRIALIFHGSLILRISRILNRSQNLFQLKF